MQSEIQITEQGYRLNDLEVTGLSDSRSLALLLRANGFTYKAAAKVMGCSADNVKNRIEDLYYELHANSTPQLVIKAMQSGFLKMLSLVVALHICLASPTDHNVARTARLHRVAAHREHKVA